MGEVRTASTEQGRRRDTPITCGRWAWLAIFLAVVGMALAACDGGSSTPHVASLGNSRGVAGGSTTTTSPTGGATQLLDEWAACMRSHGDPKQVDPVVDANKVIQLTLPAGYTEGLGALLNRGGGRSCASYMTAAQTSLRGGEPPQTPSPATAEKFAQCMRANGVPDYADPTGGQSVVHATAGSDLDPANPTFQAASTLCASKTGFQKFGNSTPQPGTINVNPGPGGFGGKPGGNGGPAANSGAGNANG
jgi:hypothetical protein